ncbi:MAG: hypothetical protein GY772_05305 [bacterium]|nr:hypothetical protein [bacterium]
MRALLLLLLLTQFATAQKLAPTIAVNDSAYRVRCSFVSTLSRADLTQIFFQFRHLKHYVGGGNLSIQKLSEGATVNELEYHYDYKVATLDMRMKRHIRASGEVFFTMSHYSRSNKLIPLVTESGGSYTFRETPKGVEVTYRQNGAMNKRIGWLYRKLILRESRHFLEDLTDYISKREKLLGFTPK